MHEGKTLKPIYKKKGNIPKLFKLQEHQVNKSHNEIIGEGGGKICAASFIS